MKTKTSQTLLPAILLGGLLFTAGCRTPTTTVGVTSRSDRTVLSVSSPVPTPVRCVWRQDGARCEHQNLTPFRLVLPGSSVHEIGISKPVKAASVEVRIQPSGAPPSRFVMDPASSGMTLVNDARRWFVL